MSPVATASSVVLHYQLLGNEIAGLIMQLLAAFITEKVEGGRN